MAECIVGDIIDMAGCIVGGNIDTVGCIVDGNIDMVMCIVGGIIDMVGCIVGSIINKVRCIVGGITNMVRCIVGNIIDMAKYIVCRLIQKDVRRGWTPPMIVIVICILTIYKHNCRALSGILSAVGDLKVSSSRITCGVLAFCLFLLLLNCLYLFCRC